MLAGRCRLVPQVQRWRRWRHRWRCASVRRRPVAEAAARGRARLPRQVPKPTPPSPQLDPRRGSEQPVLWPQRRVRPLRDGRPRLRRRRRELTTPQSPPQHDFTGRSSGFACDARRPHDHLLLRIFLRGCSRGSAGGRRLRDDPRARRAEPCLQLQLPPVSSQAISSTTAAPSSTSDRLLVDDQPDRTIMFSSFLNGKCI